MAFYEAVLAIWKLGAVPQPVSYRLPPPELAALIEVADPVAVVGLDPGDGRPWISGSESLDGIDDSSLPPLVSPYWKAMTSGGSTGRPKGIVRSHRQVAYLGWKKVHRFHLHPADRVLAPYTLTTGGGLVVDCDGERGGDVGGARAPAHEGLE